MLYKLYKTHIVFLQQIHWQDGCSDEEVFHETLRSLIRICLPSPESVSLASTVSEIIILLSQIFITRYPPSMFTDTSLSSHVITVKFVMNVLKFVATIEHCKGIDISL